MLIIRLKSFYHLLPEDCHLSDINPKKFSIKSMGIIAYAKNKLWHIESESLVLYAAAKDPRTPLLAKIIAVATVAYTLSPIDIVPDFIPVIGWVDDLVIFTAGSWLAAKMIPPEVMTDARAKASQWNSHIKRMKMWFILVSLIVVLMLAGIIAVVIYGLIRLIKS